ncbi:MAG TPA: ABC transporter substrate-binding protein [Xanthobacteraceae bacterium]
MRRREFITLFGAAAAWPLRVRAQDSTKMARVGVLWRAASAEQEGPPLNALVKGFNDLGYVEGRNLVLEHRFAGDIAERFKSMAAELVEAKVDVLVAVGKNAATAAKGATTTIPIVFTVVADPVGSNLVDSLSQPGGNVTGLASLQSDLFTQRLQMLKEILPGLARIGWLINTSTPPSRVYTDLAQAAATEVGLTNETSEWHSVNDLGPAFDKLKRANVQAFTAEPDGLAVAHAPLIGQIALARHLPLTVWSKASLKSGALMSYAADTNVMCEQTAGYADKILKGGKPGELPVLQPTKFELAFSAKTAKALGVQIPQTLLAQASEVID